MNRTCALASTATIALTFCVSSAIGQAVHVSNDKGVVTLSIAARQPYTLSSSSQTKTPVLTVACQQKGKKVSHAINFSPGSILHEQQYSTFGASASVVLEVAIGDRNYSTNWTAYGNFDTFTYFGKTEAERLSFLQALLGASTISIQFTPFLTGQPVTTTFDLTDLRVEFEKHPECAMKLP